MKKKLTQTRVNRLVFIVSITALIVFVISTIFANVFDNRYYDDRWKLESEREKSYSDLINYLEYNGLNDEAQNKMKAFCDKYTDYANFIVFDSGFNILFNINQGFIGGGSEKFYVIADSNGYGVVCDAKGNMLSVHYLNSANQDVLRRLTTVYLDTVSAPQENISEPVDPSISSIYGTEYSGRVTMSDGGPPVYSNGSFTITLNDGMRHSISQMRFHAFQSKGFYLCFIYDENSPSWTPQWDGNSFYNQARNITISIAILTFITYWLTLALFVFLDARRQDNHPALWGVLTLFTNFVGLVVYLAVRPERIYCSSCREPLGKNHSFCPVCGTRNRSKCVGCGALVGGDWAFCTNCGMKVTEVGGDEGDEGGGETTEASGGPLS